MEKITAKNMTFKEQKTINYTIKELRQLAETPLFFLQLIQANRWHRLLYRGMDLEYNEKVKFVREWYKEKTGQVK